MAYIGNYNNYAQAGRRPQTSADDNTKPTLGGGGASIGGGGGAGASAPQATGGGGYTNLISYLGANEDSGATTGRGVANVVQNDANQATSDQNAFKASAGSALDAAGKGVQSDQGVLDSINAGAPGVDNGVLNNLQTGKATSFDPVSYTGPAGGAIGVDYTGPGSLSDLTGQAGLDRSKSQHSNATLAGSAGNLAGGQEGVQNLAKQAFANPNYTQGEQNLDAFLSRGTVGGRAALEGASGLGQHGVDSANAINTDLTNKISGFRDQANATNAGYNTALGNAKNRVTATNKTYQDALDSYAAPRDSGTIIDQGTAQPNPSSYLPTGAEEVMPASSMAIPIASNAWDTANDALPNVNGALDYLKKMDPRSFSMPSIPTPSAPKLHFAHGGRVPYSNLSDMLNKRGC